jgi:exocyst complex component 8
MPGPGPTARDRSKNKIDDKIKKRMSTRYAEISSPTHFAGLPPLPPMPNITGMVSAGQNSADYSALEADEDVRDDDKVDDRKLLSSEDFDPTACK